MRKITFIILFFSWTSPLFATADVMVERDTFRGFRNSSSRHHLKRLAPQEPKVHLSLIATGENLTWSIAGNLNGKNPNVFSELEWSQVAGAGYDVQFRFPVYRRISTFVDFSQSFIFMGKATDSDYESDDRKDRVFFAEEDAGKGQVIASSVGSMYSIVDSERLKISLGGGYGWLNQQLYLINDEEGLHSSYKNHWYGPLLAQAVGFRLSEKLFINIIAIYHQVQYRAKADWNLIENFQHPVSFRHRAKGFGLDAKLLLRYQFRRELHFFMAAGYSYRTTGSGIDELYKTDSTSVKTRLNDVTGRAAECSLGVAVRF